VPHGHALQDVLGKAEQALGELGYPTLESLYWCATCSNQRRDHTRWRYPAGTKEAYAATSFAVPQLLPVDDWQARLDEVSEQALLEDYGAYRNPLTLRDEMSIERQELVEQLSRLDDDHDEGGPTV
jgi:hypothetical protein